MTPEDFQRLDIRIMASIVGLDTVIVAPVQSDTDYNYDQIEWNRRFVEIYEQSKESQWRVDYGRIDETEGIGSTPTSFIRSGKTELRGGGSIQNSEAVSGLPCTDQVSRS